MAIGVSSAPDPYTLAPSFPRFSAATVYYNEYPGRTQVSPVQISETIKGIIALGDSVLANTVPTPYTVTQTKNQTLNPSNGGLYRSADPMLGTNQGTSSGLACPLTRMGDGIISGGFAARAVMGCISYGSTLVSEWAVGGPFNQNIGAMCRRFASLNIPVSGVIWHAGPNDVTAGTNQSSYAASLTSVIATIRVFLPSVPILVGLCSDHASPNSGIRAAQSGVVNHGAGIWAGVDSDAYASGNFQAASNHLSDTGSAAIAADYITALHAAGAI